MRSIFFLLFLSLLAAECNPEEERKESEIKSLVTSFVEEMNAKNYLIDSLFFLNSFKDSTDIKLSTTFIELFQVKREDILDYNDNDISKKGINLFSNYTSSNGITDERKILETFDLKCTELKEEDTPFDCYNAVVFDTPFIKCSMPYFLKDYSKAFMVVYGINNLANQTHEIYEFSKDSNLNSWRISKKRNY